MRCQDNEAAAARRVVDSGQDDTMGDLTEAREHECKFGPVYTLASDSDKEWEGHSLRQVIWKSMDIEIPTIVLFFSLWKEVSAQRGHSTGFWVDARQEEGE
jgi:hypothetical protein